jgi:hypothetical protein
MAGFGSGIFLILLIFSIKTAFAGPCTQACQSAGQQESARCQAAVAQVNATDAARSAATGAANTALGDSAHQAALDQGRDIGQQQSAVQNAIRQCEEAKQRCSQRCDQEQQRASTVEACKMAGDPGTVPKAKQSACVAPITAMLGQLGAANSQLGQAGKQASSSSNASGGGAMPLPIPLPTGGDKSKEDKAEEPLNCDKSGYTKFVDCNQHYIQKCESNMSGAGCGDFANRYCNLGAVNNTADVAIPTPPVSGTDKLVVTFSKSQQLETGKVGEGMGSDFCQKANAWRFCQQSGRTQCPSCLQNPWPNSDKQLNEARSTCPSDPMFLDPSVVSRLNASTSSSRLSSQTVGDTKGKGSSSDKFGSASGFSASGGSSGSSLGGQTPGAVGGEISNGAVSESNNRKVNLGVDTGGGGGGSSSHDPGNFAGPSTYGTQSARAGKPTPAAPVAGLAKDVSVQFGPSVFSISSSTYKTLCSRGKLMHCKD